MTDLEAKTLLLNDACKLLVDFVSAMNGAVIDLNDLADQAKELLSDCDPDWRNNFVYFDGKDWSNEQL